MAMTISLIHEPGRSAQGFEVPAAQGSDVSLASC